jgi:hypothetical protein
VGRPHTDPWETLQSVANRQGRDARSLYAGSKLSVEELAKNPLD